MLPLSSDWYTGDTTIFKSSKIEVITSQFGIQQIIKKPTHIQGKSVSCIDLILSSQPNLVSVCSAIHSSLYQSYHHQIVLAKFNLKVHYPPPYEREVWHFKKREYRSYQEAHHEFPWERSLANLDINDIAYLFNKTIKNILSNFTPHDPPWINSQVKHLVNEKHAIYKNKKNNQSSETFQSFQSRLSSLIANLKNKYYSNVA